MRSSKSRSRSKSNRQRSIGNIVNRVFDSSGPEGKVRGTPQQIIDKYLALARDAQLSNDRVAEQNFLQHAEHYTRMLGEAQRELAREQENRQGGNGHNQGQSAGNQNSGNQGAGAATQNPQAHNPQAQNAPAQNAPAQSGGAASGPAGARGAEEAPRREGFGEARFMPAFLSVEPGEDDGPGLVETPEARLEADLSVTEGAPSEEGAAAAEDGTAPARRESTRSRRTRSPRATEGADEAPAKRPRAPRKPRSPKPAEGEAKSETAPAGPKSDGSAAAG